MVEYDTESYFLRCNFMKTVGIIAEYNPFHNGHQRQISYIRRSFHADYIIAVMSGDFVQRGTPALFSKHRRAEAALRCGVDLVLELPVAVSCSSAELFAKGGVEILDGIGVTDALCFGSEEGQLPLFQKTAQILADEPDEYQKLLRSFLKKGCSFPAARCRALAEYIHASETDMDEHVLQTFLAQPNNILGIEYCKSLLRQRSRIQPLTIRREGAGYHDQALIHGKLPSASGIRSYLKDPVSSCRMDCTQLPGMLPEASLTILNAAVQEQRLVFEEELDTLLFYRLLLEDADSLCQYLDVSCELAARILRMRNQYKGFLQFAQLIKTKELTQSRIQRALLHILLQIKGQPACADYARVLGFQKRAAPLLSAIKKEGRIPLLTKAADASFLLDSSSFRSFQETVFASNLYESLLSHRNGTDFLHETQKPIVII